MREQIEAERRDAKEWRCRRTQEERERKERAARGDKIARLGLSYLERQKVELDVHCRKFLANAKAE